MEQQRVPLTRRNFTKLAGGATTAGLLAGCLGGDSDPSSSGGSSVQVGLGSQPRTLDPIRYLSTPDAQVLNNIFNNIVGIGTDLSYYPDLAASMPETERGGQRWIVEFESDAEFHNGDPVTMEDVKYTMTQPVVEERGNAATFNIIDTIEEVDDNTLQFDLKNPYARFMLSLNTHVVPKSVREDNKGSENEWSENYVGSGPFEFVDWTTGESVTMRATEDYWKGTDPEIEEATFNLIEESSTRVTTLETGESDMVEQVPGQLYDTVEGIGGASLETTEGLRCNFIAFNCIEGPTANLDVRKGVEHCIDIDRMIDVNYGESAYRMHSPIPRNLAEEWDFPVDEWEGISNEKDVDRAAELFESGGLDPDYELKILVSGADREDDAVTIANGIQEAGYSATVERLEWGTFISTFNSGSADDMNLYLLGLSGEPDPGEFVYTLYHSDREGVDNGHYYRNDQLFDWIDQADQTTDRDERQELYSKAITHVLENRVHLPTHGSNVSWGVANHITDYALNPRPSANPRFVGENYNVGVE
ncbi:ABC transporter substrate-binding protein [Halovivax cerinus]|uniref:ABC transporter substrate-binding protein n=1 Tax=Halovivax cerinus TaxID=1487865 RepID=A0ABD5NUA1_9EURY|nr:ABC transporter substrate-binding protein [Halovivax cerinus]